MNFRSLDLNLLRVFDGLMTEGSLTRAADALSMTQPAASHALKRLHEWIGEPLFLRSAGGMKPTARAAALWPEVRAALQVLEQALAPTRFEARRDAVQFRLTMADATAATLAPALVGAIEAESAKVNLRIVPLTTRDPRALLQDGQTDLAIGHFPGVMSLIMAEGERALLRRQRLHQAPYVCTMRPGHALAEGELTLERFCAAPQLLVSLSGQPQGPVDEFLATLGRTRRVLLTVNQYHTAGRVLARSDLIAVLPSSPAAASGAYEHLLQRPLPFELAPLAVEMIWLARRDSEPAHRWLRELVTRVADFS